MNLPKKIPLTIVMLLLLSSTKLFVVAQDVPKSGLDNGSVAINPSFISSVGDIIFTPDSIALNPGDISPAFGLATKTFTTEYKAFGVVFGMDTAGDTVPTAVYNDPPNVWGGVNSSGIVDILAPVIGEIIMPGTNNPAITSFLRVEAGYADVGNLLLEVFDSSGNLIGSTINDDGTGSHSRTLMILSVPSIRSFRISSPGEDTFGVDEIQLGTPQSLVHPVGGNLIPVNGLVVVSPFISIVGVFGAVLVVLSAKRKKF